MIKTKNIARFIALALVVVMMCMTFVGCKKEEEPVNNASEQTVSSEGYELPEADLNGFVFNILCRETELLKREVWADDSTGEQIAVATFNRNALIEEHFNCLIGMNPVSESPENTLTNTFNRSVMAGDTDTHLAMGHMLYSAVESLQGTMYNWYDIPNIDFDNPWWHQSMIDAITYNKTMYLTASDFCTSSVYFTWTMIFNTQMAKNNSVDVYSMVEDGSWTLENFNKIVKNSYVGGGSGDVDMEKDTFGFVTHWNSAITNWMYALDIPVSSFTANGDYELQLNSERMINATERLYDLLYNGNGTLYFSTDAKMSEYSAGGHDEVVAKKFGAGQALFTACRILALDYLRDNSIEYGIVPYPKYNQEQTKYFSHVDGRASLMFIPYNLPADMLGKIGMLVEALSYVTYRDIMPEIEHVALLGRYSQDSQAYQMLQKTLEGRSYAFSFVYNEVSTAKPYWILSTLMRNETANFSSTWKSAEGVLKRDFDTILDKFGQNASANTAD